MADAQGEAAEFQTDRGVFRAEYERELGQWLRRRLGWLCIAYTVFQLIGTASLLGTSLLFGGDPSSGDAAVEQREGLGREGSGIEDSGRKGSTGPDGGATGATGGA